MTTKSHRRPYMPEDKDTVVQTTVRMPKSLHKAMTDEVQRRKYTDEKTSIDGLIQEALRAHLGRPAEPTPESGEGDAKVVSISGESVIPEVVLEEFSADDIAIMRRLAELRASSNPTVVELLDIADRLLKLAREGK